MGNVPTRFTQLHTLGPHKNKNVRMLVQNFVCQDFVLSGAFNIINVEGHQIQGFCVNKVMLRRFFCTILSNFKTIIMYIRIKCSSNEHDLPLFF